MTLPRETMLELMSLADGELEGEARVRAEKLVAESGEARRIVEALRAPHLGIWLGDAIGRRADTAGADDIARSVLATLSAHPEDGGVVRLDDGGARRRSRLQVAVAAGFGALALAAGLALYLRTNGNPADERAPVASVASPKVDSPLASAQPTTLAQQGGQLHRVEVDEIDSPSRGISVFEIPVAGAAAAAAMSQSPPSSVVIWIEDDPGGQ